MNLQNFHQGTATTYNRRKVKGEVFWLKTSPTSLSSSIRVCVCRITDGGFIENGAHCRLCVSCLAKWAGRPFAAFSEKSGRRNQQMLMELHGLDVEGNIREVGFQDFSRLEGAVEVAQGFLSDTRVNRVEVLKVPFCPFNVSNGPRFPGALLCEVKR